MTDLLFPEVEAPDPVELGAFLRQVWEDEIAEAPRPRGGVSPCTRYTNRDGKVTCWHSKDDYDWWIVASGQNFRLKCIQGSWTTSNSDSANTHGGGGVTDEEGDGYTQAEIIRQCKLARDRGLLAWPRFWKDNWHMHVIDVMCPNMSVEANGQVVEFLKGGDGLVGSNPDPLGGYGKDLIAKLWANRFNTVVVKPAVAFKTATSVTAQPNPNIKGGETLCVATTSGSPQGKHVYEYYNAGSKAWLKFAEATVSAGRSTLRWKFGGTHPIRVNFVSSNTSKWTNSRSGELKITTYDLVALVKERDSLKVQITDLQAKIAATNP